MTEIIFAGDRVVVPAGQSVLTALLEQGYAIPHSCQAGACQSCLMQATRGEVPTAAQQGLKPSQVAQGYFLACRCEPRDTLEVRLAGDELRHPARVVAKELLAANVLRLRLQAEGPFPYRAGQYTTLWANGVGRSYSLASVPDVDDDLELQVRRIEGGQLSPWLFDRLRCGDEVQLQEASGNCFYLDDDRERPLLLVATGTGLAPLYAIVRDALGQGHRGEIHLLHGSISPQGLYLHGELQQLESGHANFHYHACVLENPTPTPGIIAAHVETIAFGLVDRPSAWRYYLCGDPALVNAMKKRFFLAGAPLQEIYTDPFISGPPP